MRFRYLAFDPARHGRRARFRHLESIFNVLLMKTAGDVDEALAYLEMLADRYGWFDENYGIEDFKADLAADGKVAEDAEAPGSLRLSRRGERVLRREALERVFSSLAAGSAGGHRTVHPGGDGESTEETRPYAFGDALDRIAWTPTLRNALSRDGSLTFRESDLEVREMELHTGCATVMLVDVSHSMILYGEDRMMPAREVALGLMELITTRYRKDTLDLVLFGDDAEHVPLHRIPYMQAGPYHTNTKAGLRMAQEILRARKNVNKQVFMITDGKPSCIWRDGRLYKNPFGLDDEVRERTLDEALACRKAGIAVTTFMVAQDPLLVEFIDEFTRLNRGRAYFTGTDDLGAALFVDYIQNRRSRL